jgi:hypothetical protein
MFSMRMLGSLAVWLCAIMLACSAKPLWIVTGAGGPPDVR